MVAISSAPVTSRAGTATSSTRSHESGRYTAPTPQSMQESPAWVPVLMLGFFLVGAVAIAVARFLFFHRDRIAEAAA